MIRQPSTYVQLYGWWLDAVRTGLVAMVEDEPPCGFYKTRKVRGGPWVPVQISVLRILDGFGELADDERLVAQEGVDGQKFRAERIWTSLRPISREEYDALIEAHRTDPVYQATHAPADITQVTTRI